jgi:diphthamide biosynthesis methyltransferase
MLYLVGLGLADETDITIKGLEVVKRAERVYLEAYTSILLVDKEKLVRSLQVLVDLSFIYFSVYRSFLN